MTNITPNFCGPDPKLCVAGSPDREIYAFCRSFCDPVLYGSWLGVAPAVAIWVFLLRGTTRRAGECVGSCPL